EPIKEVPEFVDTDGDTDEEEATSERDGSRLTRGTETSFESIRCLRTERRRRLRTESREEGRRCLRTRDEMKTKTEKEVKYETRNGGSKMGNWERKMKTIQRRGTLRIPN
ncbi:hypothetical protein L195_g044729, partial [Trifolium pratense]